MIDQITKDYHQLGLGGVIAVTLLKILDYLTKRNGAANNSQLAGPIKSLEGAIKAQTAAITEQTKAISALTLEAKLNSQALETVCRDVSEIRSNCPRFATMKKN